MNPLQYLIDRCIGNPQTQQHINHIEINGFRQRGSMDVSVIFEIPSMLYAEINNLFGINHKYDFQFGYYIYYGCFIREFNCYDFNDIVGKITVTLSCDYFRYTDELRRIPSIKRTFIKSRSNLLPPIKIVR